MQHPCKSITTPLQHINKTVANHYNPSELSQKPLHNPDNIVTHFSNTPFIKILATPLPPVSFTPTTCNLMHISENHYNLSLTFTIPLQHLWNPLEHPDKTFSKPLQNLCDIFTKFPRGYLQNTLGECDAFSHRRPPLTFRHAAATSCERQRRQPEGAVLILGRCPQCPLGTRIGALRLGC